MIDCRNFLDQLGKDMERTWKNALKMRAGQEDEKVIIAFFQGTQLNHSQ